ncbi:MAG: hypothetical protein M1833_006689 [Piccolia ochrophora]|nr:MAG: hypothetical protein M1833_006689 [Piccolia ochrophora]
MDEIRFIVRTKDANDLKYLNKLLEANPEYTSTLERGFDSFSDYSKTWDNIDVNNDTLYIKIDDDVVFLEDTTLPIVAQKLADHPEYFAVSANVINNPALSWIHWYLGVVLPYLPEMTPPDQVLDDPDWNRSPSWRASKLPSWTGSSTFDFRSDFPAPYEGHRWLPVRNASSDDGTPITTTTFDKSSSGWWSWSVAAQQHYSFLDHLERDELWRYKFDILDYHYDRITVNLLGMRGKDIIEGRPFPRDDEGYVSQTLPKKTGRHAIIAGGALAVHMHFNAQRQAHDGHGIMWTDALERYRSYAKENVCGRPTR